MPSAELYILDPANRQLIPAEMITDEARIECLERMVQEVCQREHDIEAMRRDLFSDSVQAALTRRRLQNELSDARYKERQR